MFGYLVKPINESDLPPAIAVTMRRFEQCRALQLESADLRQALEERKLVERAKGLFMRRAGVNEEVACRRFRKLATDQRCKLAEAARWVLTIEDVIRPAEASGTADNGDRNE